MVAGFTPFPTRRGFLAALLAIPAALAACAGQTAAAPDETSCPTPPPAFHPRVDETPEYPRLRAFPLDRDVPPAFVYQAVYPTGARERL